MKKEKQKKRKFIEKEWIIFPDFKSVRENNPYLLNINDFDTNEEEVSMCIMEQIYGEFLK